jgi:hypothetical protein
VQFTRQRPEPRRHRTGPPEREQAELPTHADARDAPERLAHGCGGLRSAEEGRQHDGEPPRHHLFGERDDCRRDSGDLVDDDDARSGALAVRRMCDLVGRVVAGRPGVEQAHDLGPYPRSAARPQADSRRNGATPPGARNDGTTSPAWQSRPADTRGRHWTGRPDNRLAGRQTGTRVTMASRAPSPISATTTSTTHHATRSPAE